MTGAMAFDLQRVLHAADPAVRDAAWQDLIARHSRLLLSVCRAYGGGHDETMERYAYILEKLYEGDCRRLREFLPGGGARFSTWLTVAARRLCLDHLRGRYGRTRATLDPAAAGSQRAVRRRLADSIGADVDTDLLPDDGMESAESQTIRRERDTRLRSAVAALPPRDRLLLALRFDDDLSAARIADLIGLPTAFHVYRRLHAVLARLRGALEAQGVDGQSG